MGLTGERHACTRPACRSPDAEHRVLLSLAGNAAILRRHVTKPGREKPSLQAQCSLHSLLTDGAVSGVALGSQGPPHLCASAPTLGKQDVYLEGPGEPVATEGPKQAKCLSIPSVHWADSHLPSLCTLQVSWVFINRAQFPRGAGQTQRVLGAGEVPRDRAGRTQRSRCSGGRPGSCKGHQEVLDCREQVFCKGSWGVYAVKSLPCFASGRKGASLSR